MRHASARVSNEHADRWNDVHTGTGGDAGCVYGTTTCHCLGAGAAGMDEWFCD